MTDTIIIFATQADASAAMFAPVLNANGSRVLAWWPARGPQELYAPRFALVIDTTMRRMGLDPTTVRCLIEARTILRTGRDITLRGLIESEREANLDFIHGEGWCARQAKERAERQQAQAKAQAEYEAAYQRWRERNPEEAAEQDARRRKRLEEERKREERNRKRRDAYWANGGGSYREPKDKGDPAARYAGYDAAKKISIDLQADRQKPAGALG